MTGALAVICRMLHLRLAAWYRYLLFVRQQAAKTVSKGTGINSRNQ